MILTSKQILLIDDDIELTQLLSDYLSSEGFIVRCCHDGISGLARAYDSSIDLILLDVMMPKLNGFEVLKALGGAHTTPILMLTAKGDDADRILGLELGADDYLAKPFHHRELLARINAIFRRINIINSKQTTQPHHAINNVQLDHGKREVSCHGHLVELTGTEFEMLTCLVENHGQIVSKEVLSEQVLGRKLSAFDRSIDMHVSNIRRKLKAAGEQEKIKTIRGSGYLFLSGEQS